MPVLHLTDFDETERADYMVVIASMLGAHGDVTSEDIYALRELSLRYVLGPTARGRVLAACSDPPQNLEEIEAHLGGSHLKYSLLLDLSVMALAHDSGTLQEPEEQAIRHTAELLGVTSPQVDAILAMARVLGGGTCDAAAIDAALGAVGKAGVPQGAMAVSAVLLGLRKAEHEPVREALRSGR